MMYLPPEMALKLDQLRRQRMVDDAERERFVHQMMAKEGRRGMRGGALAVASNLARQLLHRQVGRPQESIEAPASPSPRPSWPAPREAA